MKNFTAQLEALRTVSRFDSEGISKYPVIEKAAFNKFSYCHLLSSTCIKSSSGHGVRMSVLPGFLTLIFGVLTSNITQAACTSPTTNTTISEDCSDLIIGNTGLTVTVGGGVTISRISQIASVTNNTTNTSIINDSSIVSSSNYYALKNSPNATINSITNNGTIDGNQIGIINYSQPSTGYAIDLITNNSAGYIGSSTGPAIANNGSIGSIVNLGVISGANGIENNGSINTISNSHDASIGGIGTGSSGFGIKNSSSASIATLNTGQGGSISNPALKFYGKLPTNYNIIVYNQVTYGQTFFTNPSGTTTFGIYAGGVSGIAASALTVGTYPAVLAGISLSNLTGPVNGVFGSYNWSLINSTSTIWDLVVTSSSNGGNGGNGGNATPTMSDISTGGTFALGNVGVTANPVFAGGTLVLSSGNSSSQAFSVSNAGGTIQSPNSGSATLSGLFSGTGGLTFTGSGTTVMTGANGYTGGTTVSSGTLSVQGSSPTGYGNVYVGNAGTLMGTGTINGGVTVAGILKPGNSPGYLAATNTVTMNNGSNYQQDIAGKTQASSTTPAGATGYYSNLNVTGGQFVINSGATLTPRLSNLFTPSEAGYGSAPYTPVLGDRFRIVTADGGISGKFSTVTQPSELSAGTQFLPFYNMAGSNSIDLAVIPTSYKTTIASASGNKNAQSIGAALDKMVVAAQNGTSTAAQDQLLYAGSNKSASALSGYAQSLSGEVYPAAVAAIAQTTQRVQQAVMTRLGDTMGITLPNTNPAGNTGLMATTNTALSGGVASSAVSSNPSVNPNTDAKSFSNGNVWGDLAYQYGNRNSDNNSGGWNSNLYQLVFGSDFYAANGMKIGGGLALSNTTLNPTYGSGTIQQGSIFAYGKMPVQEFVVDGMASFGLNSSDLSRGDATGLSNGFKSKSVSGNDALVSLGLSRPIDTESVRITPYARVTWQIVTQSGVNEGGAASALSVNSFTGNGVRGVIGAAVGSKTNNPMTEKYTYRAYVGVGADSSGLLNPTLNASIAGIGTNITTPNAGATFVQAGLYGTAKVSDNAYAYAGLSGEARSGQTLGAVNAGVRIQF